MIRAACRAVVDLVESVGADTYLSTAFGPAAAPRSASMPATTVTEGDHVTLHLAPGGLRLFDADGHAIARGRGSA